MMAMSKILPNMNMDHICNPNLTPCLESVPKEFESVAMLDWMNAHCKNVSLVENLWWLDAFLIKEHHTHTNLNFMFFVFS